MPASVPHLVRRLLSCRRSTWDPAYPWCPSRLGPVNSGTMDTKAQPTPAVPGQPESRPVSGTSAPEPEPQNSGSAPREQPVLNAVGFVVSAVLSVIAFPAELLMYLMDIKC